MKAFIIALLTTLALASPLTPPPPPTCQQCIPFPEQNKCHETTSCVFADLDVDREDNPKYFCACRHGYRADGYPPSDKTHQFRLDWPGQEGRVFVAPGVSCNTLCKNPSCSGVPLRSECLDSEDP